MSPHSTSALDLRLEADIERVISPDGRRHPNPMLDNFLRDIDNAALFELWRDMTIVRRIDAEGVALQRQGQLGLWPPCQGQEATQVGSARALADQDYIFPSYRETGVLYVRGAQPGDYVRAWRGEEGSGYDPQVMRMAPQQIIIGAQTLHAVGYALGIKDDGGGEIAVTYFGDGATSQGDVNEAMIFASSYQVPVVFICQNNHWAISEPVTVQSRFPLAGRAPGFGIPSLPVDGNDVLACLGATRWAAEHARSGRGPVFLEMVTYRMGPHTTADDPTRYRTDAELAAWRERDPIARVEAHLRREDALTDAQVADVQASADMAARDMRAACLAMVTRTPLSLFDNVYAESHCGLDRQRAQFATYLESIEEEEEVR